MGRYKGTLLIGFFRMLEAEGWQTGPDYGLNLVTSGDSYLGNFAKIASVGIACSWITGKEEIDALLLDIHFYE